MKLKPTHTPPDVGDLPGRLDRRKVYRYREYCCRIGEDDIGCFEYTLADALNYMRKGMAEVAGDDPEIIGSICFEDGEKRWVPRQWDGESESWIEGQWEPETIDGMNGYLFEIRDGQVVEEMVLPDGWMGS